LAAAAAFVLLLLLILTFLLPKVTVAPLDRWPKLSQQYLAVASNVVTAAAAATVLRPWWWRLLHFSVAAADTDTADTRTSKHINL